MEGDNPDMRSLRRFPNVCLRTSLALPLAAALLSLVACSRGPAATPDDPSTAAGTFGLDTVPTGAGGAQQPDLLQRADGSWVLAFARDRLGDNHAYVVTSRDGTSWSEPTRLPSAAYSDASPVIREEGDTLHAMFVSNRTGTWKAYETSSSDGRTWSPAIPVDVPAQSPQDLAIASTSSAQLLALETMTGGVVCSRRPGSRTPWPRPVTLEVRGGAPSLALDPDGLGLAWIRQGEVCSLYGETAQGTWSPRQKTVTGQVAWLRGQSELYIVATPDGRLEVQQRDGSLVARLGTGSTAPAIDPCGVRSTQGKLWITFTDETTGRIRLARERV